MVVNIVAMNDVRSGLLDEPPYVANRLRGMDQLKGSSHFPGRTASAFTVAQVVDEVGGVRALEIAFVLHREINDLAAHAM